MTDQDRLLQSALNEIRTLRSTNELQSARLEVFDNMMRMFHTLPNYGNSGMMSPDIVWEIQKHLDNQKKEPIEK